MDKHATRVLFLDFMRGFAVIVMVMGHSIDSVLSPAARATEAFRLYDGFRGFTAPMFLFVSGYAFMVATAKRWDAFRTPSKPLLKRLGKIVLLFLLGYALHIPYLSLHKLLNAVRPEQAAALFQADVLHCVAVSLLLLQVLLFLAPTRQVFAWIVLGVAALLVLASPLVWRVDFAPIISPVLSPYLNQTQLSIFPVFPFTAYLLGGVFVGHFFLLAKERGTERVFINRMFLVAAGVALGGFVLEALPVSIYPPHDFWKTSPNWFLIRIGIVMLVSLTFYFLKNLPQTVERNLILLGQASLVVYPVHLIIAYGSAANPGLMQVIGQTLEGHQAVAVGCAVLCSMVLLTHAWWFLRKHYRVPARLLQAGLASSLLYSFVTRPW